MKVNIFLFKAQIIFFDQTAKKLFDNRMILCESDLNTALSSAMLKPHLRKDESHERDYWYSPSIFCI